MYLISKERLHRELELNAKNKAKGVLNWFIKDINGFKIIYVLYDVYGVTYVFTDLSNNFDAKDRLIFGIDDRSMILGITNVDTGGV